MYYRQSTLFLMHVQVKASATGVRSETFFFVQLKIHWNGKSHFYEKMHYVDEEARRVGGRGEDECVGG
jgi:hypothetical protein